MIVGICGQKGVGKDSVADVLVKNHRFIKVGFADALKEMTATMLRYRGLSENIIWRMLNGDLKEFPNAFLCGRSPRFFMQRLGTEFRDLIDKNLWVDCFADHVRKMDRVVISDVRFLHEELFIKSRGGIVIRLDRPALKSTDTHTSEQELLRIVPDLVVANYEGQLQDTTDIILNYLKERDFP